MSCSRLFTESASASLRSARRSRAARDEASCPLLPAAPREVLHVLRDLALARGGFGGALPQLADLLRTPLLSVAAAHLLHPPPRLFETFERALALRDGLVRVTLRRSLRALHLVRRLIQLTAQLLQLRVAPLARQPFEFARGLARLLDQLLLLSLPAAAPAAAVARLPLPLSSALLFELLLLPAREFFQTPLGLRLLLLAPAAAARAAGSRTGSSSCRVRGRTGRSTPSTRARRRRRRRSGCRTRPASRARWRPPRAGVAARAARAGARHGPPACAKAAARPPSRARPASGARPSAPAPRALPAAARDDGPRGR